MSSNESVINRQQDQSDADQIRAVILANGSKPITVDEAQAEVSIWRERLGQKPYHQPIQLVQQALNALVEAGAVSEVREKGKPIAYLVDPSKVAERRGRLIEAVFTDRDKMIARKVLLQTVVAPESDLEELIGSGILQSAGIECELVSISSDVELDLVRRGALSLARETLQPVKTDDPVVESEVLRDVIERAERAQRNAEAKVDRFRAWMVRQGASVQDAEEILHGIAETGAKTPASAVEPFKWVITIGPEENEWLSEQWLRTKDDLKQNDQEFENAKTKHLACRKRLLHQEEEIMAAKRSSRWEFERMVRREIDWAASPPTVNYVDINSGRILKSEPLPKGTQRPLFEAKAEDDTEELAEPAAAPEAMAEFKATMKKLGAKVTVVRDVEIATPVEAEELGPLATPEQKKRNRKKAGES